LVGSVCVAPVLCREYRAISADTTEHASEVIASTARIDVKAAACATVFAMSSGLDEITAPNTPMTSPSSVKIVWAVQVSVQCR
jgi:hypothetical protein